MADLSTSSESHERNYWLAKVEQLKKSRPMTRDPRVELAKQAAIQELEQAAAKAFPQH